MKKYVIYGVCFFIGVILCVCSVALYIKESSSRNEAIITYDKTQNVIEEYVKSDVIVNSDLLNKDELENDENIKTESNDDSNSSIVEDNNIPIDDLPESFIYIPETDISYPVVQGEDNSYYLKHLPDGTYNKTGSIFMNCNNTIDDTNIIIYGHNMKNGTMFAPLHNYYNIEGYANEHSSLFFQWKNVLYEYKLFSVQKVKYYDEVYTIDIDNIEQWFIDQKTISVYNSEFVHDINENSKFLTLSTCSKAEDERLVTIWIRTN